MDPAADYGNAPVTLPYNGLWHWIARSVISADPPEFTHEPPFFAGCQLSSSSFPELFFLWYCFFSDFDKSVSSLDPFPSFFVDLTEANCKSPVFFFFFFFPGGYASCLVSFSSSLRKQPIFSSLLLLFLCSPLPPLHQLTPPP